MSAEKTLWFSRVENTFLLNHHRCTTIPTQSPPRSALPSDHSLIYSPTTTEQPRNDSPPPPLSDFQQTQLQAEETFYATFPDARLAKLAEEQYPMHAAVSFHYDTQPEPVQYHSDSSGTGYITDGYIAVGDDILPSPRPPDPSNSYIHNPSDFLHFNYGPNDTVTTASTFQSFPPIPHSILENNSLVQGSHYSSSVRSFFFFLKKKKTRYLIFG